MTALATRSPIDWPAAAAMTTTVLAWGSAFVVIRGVGTTFAPGPLAMGRLLIGTLALGLVLLIRRTWVKPGKKQWWLIGSVGVFWFGVYNVALNAAEQRIDAGTTAMIIQIGPLLVAIFAGVFLGEGFPRWLLVGAAVAFVGTVIIGVTALTTTTDTTKTDADFLGVALCVAAAVTYAIGILSQKPVLRTVPGLQVTWMACTIGMVCTLPFAPGLVDDLVSASTSAAAGLVYLGLVPTALAFSTWAYALTRIDAGRLGITTYAVPPVTIVLGYVLLAEIPHVFAVIGGVVCLVGVAISRRR